MVLAQALPRTEDLPLFWLCGLDSTAITCHFASEWNRVALILSRCGGKPRTWWRPQSLPHPEEQALSLLCTCSARVTQSALMKKIQPPLLGACTRPSPAPSTCFRLFLPIKKSLC